MRKYVVSGVVILVVLLTVVAGLAYAQELVNRGQIGAQASPVGTSFTYQGELKLDGEPVNEACDFQFTLYDAPSLGNQVGMTQTESITVTDGRFTVNLDFGDVFTGTARWLGIAVNCGEGSYTGLGRQELTVTPYALYALGSPWSGLTDIPPDFADDTDNTDDTVSWDEVSGIVGDGASQVAVGDHLHPGSDITSAVPTATLALSTTQASWSGLVGIPGDIADGDDDTIYDAGFGLTLVGTTFNVLTDTVQTRVTGECTVGSTIQTINADGAVVCEPHDTRPGFNQIALDTTGNVGQHTSLTIGADGLPIISYEDRSNFALKVAHCDDITCASATLTTLDTAGEIQLTSITIGADDLPIISYYGLPEYALKVAHCNDTACTSATLNILDDPGNVGTYTSIAIGADGLPIISYYDASSDDLKVAHCNDIACASATLNTLDTGGNTGRYTSIAIGIDGLPIISYQYATTLDLRVAHCNDTACTSAAIAVLDTAGDTARFTSITIGTDGLPIISYHNDTDEDLRVAHCNDTACTSASINAPDTAGDVGDFSSITIGADGLPMIGYYDHTNGNLKVARCNDAACTNAVITVLDTVSNAVLYPHVSSIAIGTDGMPIISYKDRTNEDLKVTHCSNPFCVPYWRRR